MRPKLEGRVVSPDRRALARAVTIILVWCGSPLAVGAGLTNHRRASQSRDLEIEASLRDAHRPAGAAGTSAPGVSHQTAASKDDRVMDSNPGGVFIRPIRADKMPRGCRKSSRCITPSRSACGIVRPNRRVFPCLFGRLLKVRRGRAADSRSRLVTVDRLGYV
jgi:hypothetical protein